MRVAVAVAAVSESECLVVVEVEPKVEVEGQAAIVALDFAVLPVLPGLHRAIQNLHTMCQVHG